jgi:hypothetical protein
MEKQLVEQFTAALQEPDQATTRGELLRLAPQLKGLAKDLGEALAFVATELIGTNDQELVAAYAAGRGSFTNDDEVRSRLQTIAAAFNLNRVHNTFAGQGQVFELAGACLVQWQRRPYEFQPPTTIADLATAYAAAKLSPDVRNQFARWYYSQRGKMTPAASRLLGTTPNPELLATLESLLQDALSHKSRGPRFSWIRERLSATVAEVREVRPAFLLVVAGALVALLISVGLIAAGRGFGATVSEPSVFEQLTGRLPEIKDRLKGSYLIVCPRARDDGDVRCMEVLTAAGLNETTIVHWRETRAVIGPDAPTFDRSWLTSAELSRLCRDAKNEPFTGAVYYVDLQVAQDSSAVITITSASTVPGIVLTARGTGHGLKPAVSCSQILARARQLSGDPKSPEAGRLLRQAPAAANSDRDEAQVGLTWALFHLAAGELSQAEAVLGPVWHLLSVNEKEQLPDPLVRKLEQSHRSLQAQVRDQLELAVNPQGK